MAELYKRPDSPYWWCVYRVNGILKRKSIKIRIGNSRGKKPSIGSDAEKWLIKFENDLAFKQIGISTVHDIALTELIPKYVAHYKQQFETGAIVENTWEKVEKRAPLWLKRCLKHGITGVKALTPELTLQYRSKRTKNDIPNGEPVTQNTWNRECTDLGQLWTFAKDKLGIDCKNYWSNAYYSKAKTVNKKRCLSDNEIQKLLIDGQKLDREWQFLTYVMYFTGARIHSVAELQKKSVHLSDRTIWLSNKNSDDHNSYMPEKLHDFLQDYISQSTDDLYLKKPFSGSTRTKFWTGKWPKLALKVGVKCTPHDIRNTYITRTTQKLEQRVSMNIVGHSSAKIHELYNHNMAWQYADEIERVLSVSKLQDKKSNASVLQSVG